MPIPTTQSEDPEFLRRRLKLITAYDDKLLLAIALGLVDVAAVAQAVRGKGGQG